MANKSDALAMPSGLGVATTASARPHVRACTRSDNASWQNADMHRSVNTALHGTARHGAATTMAIDGQSKTPIIITHPQSTTDATTHTRTQ